MKYFDYNKTYEENRKAFTSLCKKYHPDTRTGNEEIMKAVNNEWELYRDTYSNKNNQQIAGWDVVEAFWDIFQDAEQEEDESDGEEYIVFMGKEYLIDENILRTIALRYGGLGLMQFTNSREWQDYIKKQSA